MATIQAISFELRKLAEELNKNESRENSANSNLGGAKAKFEMAQIAFTTAQTALESAEKFVAGVNARKAALLKQVQDLAFTANQGLLPLSGGEIYSRKIDSLDGLSARTCLSLLAENIHYIGDLVQCTEIELLKTENVGREQLNEIREALTSCGLTPHMKLINWLRPTGSP